MLRTYKAILRDNQVEWLEQPPEKSGAVQVYITVLEESVPEPLPKRGRVMAAALAELARRGSFAEITDPISWQRELRSERALPDREA